jgi:hypothetical protein
MAANLVALASRKPDRRTAGRDVAMELRAERHEDHEFARAMHGMKYPADLERERRMAEIVRQLREARAQVPPSYPPVRDWRRAA